MKNRNEIVIWNRISRYYDTIMKLDKTLYDNISLEILKNIKPGIKILDIATGTGGIAFRLAKTKSHITAVDFSNKMIEKARYKASKQKIDNVVFFEENASNLSFEDNSFDLVLIVNALHILPNPDKVISEAKRVLAKDGILIIPTFLHDYTKRARLKTKIMGVSGFKSYTYWNKLTFKRFIEKNGFRVIKEKYFDSSFRLAYVEVKIIK